MDLGKAVETFYAAYNEVFDRGDAAGCAAFLTEDVLSMARDQPMMRGGDAFEQADHTRMVQSRGGTYTNSWIEFGEDEILYRVGTFAISGTTPSEQGKFLNVLRQQAPTALGSPLSRCSTATDFNKSAAGRGHEKRSEDKPQTFLRLLAVLNT